MTILTTIYNHTWGELVKFFFPFSSFSTFTLLSFALATRVTRLGLTDCLFALVLDGHDDHVRLVDEVHGTDEHGRRPGKEQNRKPLLNRFLTA
jgi:hypothetical protein